MEYIFGVYYVHRKYKMASILCCIPTVMREHMLCLYPWFNSTVTIETHTMSVFVAITDWVKASLSLSLVTKFI